MNNQWVKGKIKFKKQTLETNENENVLKPMGYGCSSAKMETLIDYYSIWNYMAINNPSPQEVAIGGS